MKELKNFEFGMVRKRDGKVVNVAMIELLRQYPHADMLNNEIRLNGEIFLADSFQPALKEVELSVQRLLNGGADGAYAINGISYREDKAFLVTQNSTIVAALQPNEASMISAITDETGKQLDFKDTCNIIVDQNKRISIAFSLKEIK